MKFLKITIYLFLACLLLILVTLPFLLKKEVPKKITYGMSFNTLYATELGLDWKETYDAIIDDLGVKYLRLAAHWPMVEPEAGEYNFTELDYQVQKAEAAGAEIILAVGRRLPRWPECHVPSWAKAYSVERRNEKQLEYMKIVVNRYKESKAVKYWQVENEPFLEVFAFEHCGELDEYFLDQEIALVRELDPTRQIVVTDSGNLGKWTGAYRRGDIFGTSVYVYFWNPELGQFKTLLPAWSYRVKENLVALFYGRKQTFLIELSAEPWLIAPISTVPLDTQLTRMDVTKFENILAYAESTRYARQYLWGAEWWYWLTKVGKKEMWDRGKLLFSQQTAEE